jgi:hypothetical protein
MSMETYAGLMPKFIESNTPPLPESPWFDRLIYRPAGYPVPNRPLTPEGAARTVPVFLNGCTQFCVEFAGDFFTQVNHHPNDDKEIGRISANGSDGIIDFAYEANTNPGAQTGRGKRTIRWYGYPRDTDGDGLIRTPEWAKRNNKEPHALRDVLPVRDWGRIMSPGLERFSFEMKGITHPDEFRFMKDTPDDYTIPQDGFAVPILQPTHEYITLWAANTQQSLRPKLIRITVGLDDAKRRIGSEQYFEYIVEVR